MEKPVRIVILVLAVAVVAGAIWFSTQPESGPSSLPNEIGSLPSSTPAAPMATVSSTSMQESNASSSASSSLSESITIWKNYSNATLGISFSYPPTWSVGSANPIELDDFSNKYANGGIIPAGGAEIDMTATAFYDSLDQFIAGDLSGATITATSSATFAGRSCIEVFYDDSFGAGESSKNVAVYCPHGAAIFKAYLAYWPTDPKGAQDVTTFKQILSSMAFGK